MSPLSPLSPTRSAHPARPTKLQWRPVLVSHALCPYVQRAVIVLEEKQAQYERIDIDLAAKPEWFRALSPLGKTPLLQVDEGHGPAAIFESAVICEYLEDTMTPPLHPADTLQRARHRAWVEFASATLNAVWSFYTAREEDGYRQAGEKLRAMFLQLEAALGDGPWFGGARFSLVDAAFAPVFRYFDLFDPVAGIDLYADTPRVQAWRAQLAARPSVRAAVSSDYARRLRQFVIDQGGVLGRRLQ